MSSLANLPQGPLAINIFEPDLYEGSHKGDAILVHGFTGSKEDFDYIGPLLAKRGYRVFAPDNRAQHESPIAENDSAYTSQAHGRDVVDLVRHFNLDRPHLFGHSFGGLVAQCAVVQSPELFRSLTLFCSGPCAQPTPRFSAQLAKELPGKTMQEAWEEFAEAMYVNHPRKELMKKRWLANDPLSLLVHARELATFESVLSEIAARKIPAHVVYGENDDAWPLEMQNEMAKDLSAQLSIIKDAGHCPNEDQPEAAVKVIADFWDTSSLY
jgi:pimeloyl-ACP methyl ester carboxylesterase